MSRVRRVSGDRKGRSRVQRRAKVMEGRSSSGSARRYGRGRSASACAPGASRWSGAGRGLAVEPLLSGFDDTRRFCSGILSQRPGRPHRTPLGRRLACRRPLFPDRSPRRSVHAPKRALPTVFPPRRLDGRFWTLPLGARLSAHAPFPSRCASSRPPLRLRPLATVAFARQCPAGSTAVRVESEPSRLCPWTGRQSRARAEEDRDCVAGIWLACGEGRRGKGGSAFKLAQRGPPSAAWGEERNGRVARTIPSDPRAGPRPQPRGRRRPHCPLLSALAREPRPCLDATLPPADPATAEEGGGAPGRARRLV